MPRDLCCGCGVCAGVCPAGALTIRWNSYGEYVASEVTGRCTDCGLCLRICPFAAKDEDETTLAEREFGSQDGVRRDSVTGLYLDTFSGYSMVDNHRSRGAGGGTATWFLERLLKSGAVDGVCCVGPNEDPDLLFRFSIVDSVDRLRSSSRSAYYPVELSGVISEMLNREGRYAVIGLPCAVKGLRLAMLHRKDLRKRIVAVGGLVCGQQKSRFFAEYLCALSGGDPARMTSAVFRVKDPARHHLDHRFEFTCESANGRVKGHIYQSEGMSSLWGRDCFKLGACNFCDDITAETADITFGDAIAESYSYGNRGANFVIARSRMALDLLLEGREKGEVVLDRVPVEAIVERQQGVIKLKRDDLRHRLHISGRARHGGYVPHKRITPMPRRDVAANLDMKMRDMTREMSRAVYGRFRHQPDVVHEFEAEMRRLKQNWTCRMLNGLAGVKECARHIVRRLKWGAGA